MAPVQASDDPRAARSRYAIRAAARHLLETEGPAAVTHQRVALEAGVGRATVYRHWPGPDQLLQEVIGEVEFPFFRDPQTPVRDWMFEELRRLADELALPALAGVAITLMHRGRWDPSIADQRDQLLNVVNHRLAAAIDYAARGWGAGPTTTRAVPARRITPRAAPLPHRNASPQHPRPAHRAINPKRHPMAGPRAAGKSKIDPCNESLLGISIRIGRRVCNAGSQYGEWAN